MWNKQVMSRGGLLIDDALYKVELDFEREE